MFICENAAGLKSRINKNNATETPITIGIATLFALKYLET
jgi:hypothetical protein